MRERALAHPTFREAVDRKLGREAPLSHLRGR